MSEKIELLALLVKNEQYKKMTGNVNQAHPIAVNQVFCSQMQQTRWLKNSAHWTKFVFQYCAVIQCLHKVK